MFSSNDHKLKLCKLKESSLREDLRNKKQPNPQLLGEHKRLQEEMNKLRILNNKDKIKNKQPIINYMEGMNSSTKISSKVVMRNIHSE